MGARGPMPLPSATHALRGNKYTLAARAGEPVAGVEAPTCPAFLGKEGKAEWNRIVPLLIDRKTLSKGDRAMLTVYCQAWDEFATAAKRVTALNAPGAPPYGNDNLVDHPRVILNKATERLMRAADRFGLSPATKVRVRAENPTEAKNPKSKFFPAGPALVADAG